MAVKSKNLLVFGVCLAAIAVTSVVVITRASIEASSPAAQVSTEVAVRNGARNLSLQPEALRVSRRLGQRFKASRDGTSTTSVMSATLTIAGSDQPVTLTRRQVE